METWKDPACTKMWQNITSWLHDYGHKKMFVSPFLNFMENGAKCINYYLLLLSLASNRSLLICSQEYRNYDSFHVQASCTFNNETKTMCLYVAPECSYHLLLKNVLCCTDYVDCLYVTPGHAVYCCWIPYVAPAECECHSSNLPDCWHQRLDRVLMSQPRFQFQKTRVTSVERY